MSAAPRIVILSDASTDVDSSNRLPDLARELDLTLASVEDWRANADAAIRWNRDRLELLAADIEGDHGVSVDFHQLASIRHGRVHVSRDQPLARAFKDVRTIIDATAGLGNDAFVLATLGYCVTAVERSPALFALVRDGLQRALDDGRIRNAIDDRLALRYDDARRVLRQLAAEGVDRRPDAIYLDPMFPTRRKESALPKKAIRAVRAAVGDDSDALELFNLAVQAAQRRIVVKRSDDAPPLAPGAVGQVRSKLVRFDIYAPQAIGLMDIALETSE